jgi:hypothetical protein
MHAELPDQGRQRIAVGHSRYQPTLHPLHRRSEAVGGDRFQQIVDGAALERIDGVLVIGGDKDDLGRRTDLSGGRSHLQSGQAGHPDIEKGHLGSMRVDRLQRAGTVLALGNDLELGPCLAQGIEQRFAQQRLVFSHDRLNHGTPHRKTFRER